MPVYDDEKQKLDSPGSHDDLGMDQATRAAEVSKLENQFNYNPTDKKTTPSTSDLKNAEETPNSSDQIGSGYVDLDGKPGKKKRRFTRRQKTGGGIFAGFLVGGLFGVLSIATGPTQLIHLSQNLSLNFSNSDNATNLRLRGLFRWARTGDIAQTRLSYLGAKKYSSITKILSNNGIEIHTSSTSLQQAITIDTSSNPNYKGLTEDQARTRIAKDLGVSSSEVKKINSSKVGGSKFAVITKDYSIAKQGRITRSAVRLTEFRRFKKFNSYFGTRAINKALKLPSFFHPLKRLTAGLDKKVDTGIRNTASKYKKIREQRKLARTTKSAKTLRLGSGVKPKLKTPAKIVGGITLGLEALCTARNVANQIPELNRGYIVIPLLSNAMEAMALGAQLQFGGQVDMEQVSAIVDGFTDSDGQTIWDGEALRAQMGQTGGVGVDGQIKDAFNPNNNTSAITSGLNGHGADAACSTGGRIIAGAAGIALFFATGGTSSLVSTAAGAAVGTAAMAAVETYLPVLLANEPFLPNFLEGPQGGNGVALGAREAAGSQYRSSGGVELSSRQSSILQRQADDINQQEFQSKSLFARTFDTKDYRSLASKIIDKQNTNIATTVASLGPSLINNSRSLFNNMASIFMGKASAVSADAYFEDLPRYGFSQEDLDNPAFDNPYENAEKVANILDSRAGSSFIDRAKSCFGVSISKNNTGWDAVVEEDVNPGNKDYLDANCGDRDENWISLRFFIMDTQIMEGYSCYEGDEISCEKLGAGSNPNTSLSGDITNANIYIVGDSLTEGLKNSGLKQELADIGYNALINAQSSRPLYYPNGSNGSITDGFTALETDATFVSTAGTIVIGLGTNKVEVSDDVFGQKVGEFIDKIRQSNKSARIFWTNLSGTGAHNTYSTRNNLLESLSLTKNFTVINWSSSSSTYLSSNEVHPSAAGYNFMVDLIIDSVGIPQSSSTIVGDPFSDSTSVACAAGTRDVGVHEGYNSGVKINLRLCAIPNLTNSGLASTPGTAFYIDGAEGDAIVSSRVSGAILAMVTSASNANVQLRAFSSFRPMSQQEVLFANNPDPSLVARPGYSNHQTGLAIDFLGMQVKGSALCTTSNRARAENSPGWIWLRDNAHNYGYYQYSKEAWHWDPLTSSTRCGPNV